MGSLRGRKKKSWNFQGRPGRNFQRDFIENETWLSWNGKRVRSESRKQGERNKSAKIAANTASGDGEEAPTRTRTTTSGTARASRQRARTRDCSLASALRAAASALRAGSVSPEFSCGFLAAFRLDPGEALGKLRAAATRKEQRNQSKPRRTAARTAPNAALSLPQNRFKNRSKIEPTSSQHGSKIAPRSLPEAKKTRTAT